MSHIITKTDLDDSINANMNNAAIYVTKKHVIFIFHAGYHKIGCMIIFGKEVFVILGK